MVRKLMMTTAAVCLGAALLALPTTASYAGGMDEMSAQAGTKGAGAPRTGTGPGTDMGNPSVSNDTGPGANPITSGTPRRHVRHNRHRSTVGAGAPKQQ
jgi:hypothetical protein